jgi:hypothetical protein
MAYHDWSEINFDWKALNECCDFFATNLRRWGRIQISGCKEKYGTMRLEWFMWNGHYSQFIHSMIFPGYLHIRYPKWMYKVDWIITDIAAKSGISRAVSAYQRLIFNIVTVIAVKKWPHIHDEILDELEFDELLYSYVKKKIKYECNWTTMT